MTTTRRPLLTRLLALGAVTAAGAFAVGGCSDDAPDTARTTVVATLPPTSTTLTPMPVGHIVGQALEAGVFTELAGLLIDASGDDLNLLDVLRDPASQFTVFAPTNDAFPDALKPVLDVLHQPEHLKELRAVLTYHVVPGKLSAADLKDGELKTVQGETLKITHQGDKVLVNGIEIAKTDVPASNGVIHVINQVLVPPSLMPTVESILKSAPAPSTTTAGSTVPGSSVAPSSVAPSTTTA